MPKTSKTGLFKMNDVGATGANEFVESCATIIVTGTVSCNGHACACACAGTGCGCACGCACV